MTWPGAHLTDGVSRLTVRFHHAQGLEDYLAHFQATAAIAFLVGDLPLDFPGALAHSRLGPPV